MPQWDRDRSAMSYSDERWQAQCAPDAVPLLRRYDHHTVWISGRLALLLTYQWDLEPAISPTVTRTAIVSFTYPAGHPHAPAEVQALVDGLSFVAVTDRDRAS
jgi:hypothetical protein